MQDEDKTKDQLITELHELRRRLAESEMGRMERNRTDEALRESEQRYRELFEAGSDAILFIDKDTGLILEANGTASAMFGYSHEELLTKRNWELSEEPEETRRITQGAKTAPGQVITVPLRYLRRKDGTIFPTEITGRSFLWQKRSVFIADIRDISERKQAEAALQASEREKATLNEIANVFLTIPDERIYEEVLSVVLKRMQSGYGVFGFISETGDLVIPSMTREVWSNCHVPEKSIVFPVHTWANSFWGKAIREQQTFCSDGPFQTPEGHMLIDNFLTVPVIFGNKTIGLVSVANKDGGYTEEDKIQMGHIANAISPILNVRLERDRQQREREKAEEALRESEEQYRNLIENSPIGIYRTTVGAEGNYLAANPAFLRLFGFDSFEELKQLTPAQRYVNPSERTIFSDRLLAQGGISVEHQLKKKDGTPIWGSITARVVRGENGEALCFDCTVEDVTARKLAEKALQESEAKYRGIVEDQIELVSRFLPDGTVTFANRAYCRYFGENPSDLLGHTFWHHLPLEDQDKFKQYLSEFSVHQPISTIEHRVIDERGNVRWQQWTDRAIFDAEGDLVEFQAVGRDITELKRAEEALRESEQKFRTLVDQAGDALFLHTLNGRIVDINQATIKRYGYTREELLELTADEIDTDYFQREQGGLFWNKFGKMGLLSFEAKHRRRDGTVFPVEVTLSAVAVGGSPHILALARDITERKRAEEAQARLQAQLANALEMAHLGPWEYDVVSDLFTFNDQFYKIFRTTANQVGGYNISSAEYSSRFVHPQDMHLVGEETRKAIETPDPQFSRQLEHRILYKDGSVGYISVRFFIVKDEHGRTIKTYGVNQDITERIQAEKKHKDQSIFLQTLLDAIPISVFYKGEDGIYLGCNKAYAQFLGLSKEQIVGEGVHAIFPKDLAEIYYEKDKDLFGAPGIQQYESEMTHADGTFHDVLFTKATYQDETGKVAGLIGAMLDITERKRAEEALRESEEKYRNLFENAPIGIFRTDSQGRVLSANSTMASILGFSSPQKALEHYSDLGAQLYVHAERRKEFLELLSQEGHVEDFEYEARTSDGQNIWLSMNARVESHGKDDSLIIEGFTTDITERRRAEEERRRLEAQLRQGQKMEAVGTLAGGIAHEFNNILGIILGYAELTKADIPEWSPAKFNLDEIKAASLRAKDVVRQLLTFSRKSEENLRLLDLVPVVKEAIKFLRASIPSNIQIRQNIAEESRPVIADPTQIHQVMLNLSTNAAHAMEEKGGVLEFSLKNISLDNTGHGLDSKLQPGEYEMLQVGDTGSGIPNEILDRIFDPYFTTKDVGKGTGMGLSVVHGIVEAHRGLIQVESALGKGTTFRILFPAAKEEGRVALELEEDLPTGSEQILFIDDEPALAKLGQLILEKLGYQVQAETNATRALELFGSNPEQFDLIITDTTMPGMTGDQLIKKVLQIRPDMKTILCTGYIERVDEESAQAIGAKVYALKPLDRKRLAVTVRNVLDASS